MARRPAPPSASPASPAASFPSAKKKRTKSAPVPSTPRNTKRGGTTNVDVREWASGIRLSAFSVIMLSLVVLGAWVLVPTLGTFIDQRQKIAALEASVQVSKGEIDDLIAERERWSDPAYITTQARERLYYVKPGEIVYLIDNDLDPSQLPREQDPVSDTLEEKPADWMPQLLRTIVSAGLSDTASVAP
ncbi:septum formation initiator family protein [Microbacterium sp. W4I20]|uniref:FtsB family cell division protein n=1 Tax=Microbacterium sp. W4I20 TaxID=3042262 RepID=UPI00278B17DA|nr:septum formation initiator family protein [Microbacterium sp. W4I20]MDQ0726092.1 cell division protein FtsB [Microbacterium sp. W4I20]